MEDLRTQNKIKLLFEKILEPNYVLNNYYADGIINKLKNCSDPEISFLERVPLISDLIIEAFNHIDNVHTTVKVFLIRILAITAYKELHFAKIFAQKGDKILEGFKQISSETMNPSLRVAYMEVALEIVKHNSGISTLLESGVWKEILSLYNKKRTVFVVRQTYKFAAEFLWKLNDLDDQDSIKLVLNQVIEPISDINSLVAESLTSEEEEDLCKLLDPMLHAMLSIISKYDRLVTVSLLMHIMIIEWSIHKRLYMVMDRIRNENTLLLISKMCFLINLTKRFQLKPMTPGLVYERKDFMETSAMFFNGTRCLIQRRFANVALDFCIVCSIIWNDIFEKNSIVMERTDPAMEFQDQVLFIFLVPLLSYLKSNKPDNDRINDYILKLSNRSCEHTSGVAYAMRDAMYTDSLSVTLSCVKKLTCLQSHFNNAQANLVFQALFFILKEYDPTDDDGEVIEENFEESQEKVLVMTYVMDAVLSLVKNHNINWHESLEVIMLYNIVFNILKRPNLSCKFVVTALNVITLTVKKFLPPNLSLLLESKPGSAMHEIGQLIYRKMQDMHWEIRDSALELLLVCTKISYIKFPPFQKQIMENNLINLAVTITFHDFEPYVQASALKCIGASSKISTVWEHLKTEYPNIEDQLLSILRNNPEGLVRKEACSVLCEVYQNLKLTPAFKNTLYEHMVWSALSDFHWEVQLTALKFWKIVVQSLLNDQGMLDGTFPPVTFSRESRKIVTLNEAEIQKRLLRILEELSSIGCLTVFVKLLQDDVEAEIMANTLSIAVEFLEILDKYKVPESLQPKQGDPANVEEVLVDMHKDLNSNESAMEVGSSENISTPDNVIDSILNADDINLLANIYERHMTIQPSEKSEKKITRLSKVATPYLFVNYMKSNNISAIVEDKRKWNVGIRSFSSLLDDVLGLYDDKEEVNSLDCY